MQKEIELVREKIRLACDRAGRDSETVLLLGVSRPSLIPHCKKPTLTVFTISERIKCRKSGRNMK